MSMSVSLHWVRYEVRRSVDRSRKFFRFHRLRSFQRHYKIVPFDCNGNYCSQHLDSVDAVVGAVVNDVDAVDIVHGLRRRPYSDCYDKQHSDYCYCAVAAAADTVQYFVRSVEHSCHIDRSICVGYFDAVVVQQQHYLRDCEHFAKRYYECYFVAHSFVTDNCLDCYDDCFVIGMVVVVVVAVAVVVVGIYVGSLVVVVVYADDYYFVMRTIVNCLVRAPELIVADC